MMARKHEIDLEAPLPPLPPSMYSKESNFSFIRPSDIEGNEWNGRNDKGKEVAVRSVWSNNAPPTSNGEFRAQQHHNKVITNNSHKFSTLNNMSETQNFRNKTLTANSNAAVNTQLFSEEFLSYLSMIH
jgi:hypothetical protein